MMYHIIYKTTNLLNGRFYIGMHSTDNIDDGYLGSGKRIIAELKKYGKENFVRVIIGQTTSREALKTKEAELVTEELRKDPLCLNLKNGGEGGWDHLDNEKMKSVRSANLAKAREKLTTEIRSKAAKSWIRDPDHDYATFTGRKHSEETKQKMREAHAKRNRVTNFDGEVQPLKLRERSSNLR